MSTIRDLIVDALTDLGALASGETPTANEQAACFRALTQMLDSWSAQNLMIFAKIREPFPLSGGVQMYTMGPSGIFDTPRPTVIEEATLQDVAATNQPEYPMNVIYVQEWAGISDKSLQSSYPTKLYIEDTFPQKKLYVWPIPTVANNLVLYSKKPLSTFTSVDDEVELPPGYELAIRKNLAISLGPQYGLIPSDDLRMEARDSKGVVKTANIKPEFLEVDAALLQNSNTFDYRTGQ